MRISIDIDDVVIDFTAGWQPIYENYFGVPVGGPVDGWDVCDFTHFESNAEFFEWWNRIDGWQHLGWVPGARAAIDWILSRPGWHVVFNTSRASEQAVNDALRLGGRYGIWPRAQVKTNSYQKTQVPADLHIDDAPHVAEQFIEAGKPMILFDRPWNQDVDAASAEEVLTGGRSAVDHIIRANNWLEVIQLIEEVPA